MKISKDKIREWLKVYFIMGSTNCDKDPRDILRESIEGGITLFQFREKGKEALTGKEKLQLAIDLQEICRANHIPFIVNDDINLAVAIDADGVHVGQDDEPAYKVRERIGENKIIGVSAHTVEEAITAVEQGADYLGIGPIYQTTTKEDAKEAKGTALIKTLKNIGLDIPMVGIGGIKKENAQKVVADGADGISVITAISQAESVAEAARLLRKAVLG